MKRRLFINIVGKMLFVSFVGCLMQISGNSMCLSFTLPELLAHSESVFEGKVIAIKRAPKDKYINEVTFRVERVWKGEIDRRVVVFDDGGACGTFLRKNKQYIVFIDRNRWDDEKTFLDERKGLWANICATRESTDKLRNFLNHFDENVMSQEIFINRLYIASRESDKFLEKSNKTITAVLIVFLCLGIGVLHSWIRYRRL